jgi:hypothetical protein
MPISSSANKADELMRLAEKRFPGLREAEMKLLRAAPAGEGEVRLANSMTKGTLVWMGVRNPERAALNLSHASAGAILDDKASWPAAGKLKLDGFAYDQWLRV